MIQWLRRLMHRQTFEELVTAKLEVIQCRQEIILHRLESIERKVDVMASSLDDVLAAVTAETTRLDSITTLITGLKQQLADALSGTTLPAAVQAKVDSIFNQAQVNSAKIDTALNTNVPPPATPPAP